MAPYKVNVTYGFKDVKTDLMVFAPSQNQPVHLSYAEKTKEFEIPDESGHLLRIRVAPGAKSSEGWKVKLPSRGELKFVPETTIATSILQDGSGGVLVIPVNHTNWEIQIVPPDAKLESMRGDGEEDPDNISVGENGDGG
jgi:hypothetical protein